MVEKSVPAIVEKAFEALTGKVPPPVCRRTERRRQKRYAVPIWDASLTLLLGGAQEDCRLLNLSTAGISFRTAASVEEGAEYELLLSLQEPPLGMTRVTVEARWVRRLEYGYADVGAAVLDSSRDWLAAANVDKPSSSFDMNKENTVDNHLKQDRELAKQRLGEVLSSEHWLGDYISVLLSSFELNSDLDFATAQKLLETERAEFEKDLAIARRMFRLYPSQFTTEAGVSQDVRRDMDQP